MIIQAKFKGSSSCGFQHGLTYNLLTKNTYQKLSPCGKKKPYIWIFDWNSNAKCPYESLSAFLDNWEVIGLV